MKEINEDYLELKQNVLEYLLMLSYVKDNEIESKWIKDRIKFNVKMMLNIMNKNNDCYERT